jgi:hypothetical protein
MFKKRNVIVWRAKHLEHLKLGCLHPVACTRSGSGFPSNGNHEPDLEHVVKLQITPRKFGRDCQLHYSY